jgi:hypothetical protein
MSNFIALLRPHKSVKLILWMSLLPLVLAPTGGLTLASNHRATMSAQPARVVEGYSKLPLAFEANQGQTDSEAKFFSRGAGFSLFLTSTEADLGHSFKARTWLACCKISARSSRAARDA